MNMTPVDDRESQAPPPVPRRWVRLTKIAQSVDPIVAACPPDAFLPGEENLLSLPVDYWIEGFLLAPPQIGKRLAVERHVRNGVEALGLLQTTPLVRIESDRLETWNSVYQIEYRDGGEVIGIPPICESL